MLPKRYNPSTAEPGLQARWAEAGTYHFDPAAEGPVYSIDTPPPTVSGHLHLGHVYSYSHTDFVARFWRMNGHNVFYPMGFDDNGLPTERLVERWRGVRAADVGRQAFVELCLQVSEEAEEDYRALWQRLGLSVDWRYSYRTVDDQSRRIAQASFLALFAKGLAYRQQAPTIWCPECDTAIAQAEVDDLERESQFYTLAFRLADGEILPIATTRPELLPACVAIFVHPDDRRFAALVGQTATVPLFGQAVPILADPGADPEKGSGAVMCCTFGDAADVHWWRLHELPLVEAIGRDGRMTAAAGDLAGQSVTQARSLVAVDLENAGLLLTQRPVSQTVRVHERCDTPVEHVVGPQWFVRALDFKQELLAAGEQVRWYPDHMKARYRQWVENLGWDWCISRQRAFGVPFPVWFCDACGEAAVADLVDLPIDPSLTQPRQACACSSTRFSPETDVMDTWATSSLTPQIVGRWLEDPHLYGQLFPMSLRPQAHEIIRTWAFYTILKSHHHFGVIPWSDVMISGWGLAPEGTGKISKSRGGGPAAPMEMIERYSADALRYWAASTGPGRDAVISEEKIEAGARLVTKLWNVARFSERFLAGYRPAQDHLAISPADAWILSLAQRLIDRTTALFHEYDYATAKSETEAFFWRSLADNYLEMAKVVLYDDSSPLYPGARDTLYRTLLAVIKLFAPILPYVTEEIYGGLFAAHEGASSIHRAPWPAVDASSVDEAAEAAGEVLVDIATAVRRYKSQASLPLGAPLARLQLATADPALAERLRLAEPNLRSVTRAGEIDVGTALDTGVTPLETVGSVAIAILEA